jgi:hypothetical protein
VVPREPPGRDATPRSSSDTVKHGKLVKHRLSLDDAVLHDDTVYFTVCPFPARQVQDDYSYDTHICNILIMLFVTTNAIKNSKTKHFFIIFFIIA